MSDQEKTTRQPFQAGEHRETAGEQQPAQTKTEGKREPDDALTLAENLRTEGRMVVAQLLEDLDNAKDFPMLLAKVLIQAIVRGIAFQSEIAAQLAELNERDTAAEIRAKAAEDFVEEFQRQIAQAQQSGLVVPATTVVQQQRGPGR